MRGGGRLQLGVGRGREQERMGEQESAAAQRGELVQGVEPGRDGQPR